MKKILKRITRLAGYTLGSFIGLVLLYFGCAWLLSHIAVNKDAALHGDKNITIYIRTNGVHTDIVTPVKNEERDWSTLIPFYNTQSGDTAMRYIAFGWGDKGFYLQTPDWADLKCSVAFKAMFHLGSTAMHVSYCKEMNTGTACREIRISTEQYRKLVAYLQASFHTDENGHFVLVPASKGYGKDDAFYEANGVYDLFHTCNTWANNALKACDQRACLWTPMDKGIFYQYPEP